MTKEEHIERHKKLHDALDELLADFLYHTTALPSKTPILKLMQWSRKQTIDPTEKL